MNGTESELGMDMMKAKMKMKPMEGEVKSMTLWVVVCENSFLKDGKNKI